MIRNIEDIPGVLERVYETLSETRKSYEKKPTRPTVIIREKRTLVTNFTKVCSRLNRTTEDAISFINSELESKVSCIMSDNALVIGTHLSVTKVESVVRKYINARVKCMKCKSLNTVRKKVKRVMTTVCINCISHPAFRHPAGDPDPPPTCLRRGPQ